MKTDLEKINAVQHRLKVQVPADEVNQGFDSAYQNLKNKVQIQGFRKGHAPLGMIKKMYKDHVQAEVSENLIRTFLPQALQKGLQANSELKPAGYPMLEEAKQAVYGEDFSFSAVIDVLPEVKVENYKGMTLTCFKQDTTESNVEKELERIKASHGKAKSVDGSTGIADGHLVTLSIKATDAESGEPVGLESSDKTMGTIGKKELAPYVEEAIKGKTSSEDVGFEHTFADSDETAEPLRGRKLKYFVNIQQVQTLEYPDLDDEFAKDLGLESLADLKNRIQDNLQASLDRNRRSQLEESALNQLLEKNDVEVPPTVVDRLINEMMSEFPFQNKADRDKAIKNQDFRKRLQPSARRRAQNTFLLWQVAQNEGLEVSEEQIKDEIKKQLGQAGKEPSEKEVEDAYNRAGSALKENMTVSKAMDFIIDHAKVEEKDPPQEEPGHVHDENCNHDH